MTSLADAKMAFYASKGYFGSLADAENAYYLDPPPGGGAGGVPDDNSVTDVKVAGNAAISLDKTANSATRLAITDVQVTKLTNIATGATANDTDANLKNRANHTGTQLVSTISDFNGGADSRIANAAGVSIASLSAGKIPSSQLPAIGLVTVQTAANQAAQLALTTQEGDVVVRTDSGNSYMRNNGVTGTMTDFTQLSSSGAVTSVNGNTGVVVLAKTDVGLGNVDNTSDVNKPVSTAQATADNLKANLASPTFTGTVTVPTPAVSGAATTKTYVDSADNLKAPIAAPTFTGTVTVPTPGSGPAAANKTYVDGLIAALFPNLGTQRIAFVGYGTSLPGSGTDGDVFFLQV